MSTNLSERMDAIHSFKVLDYAGEPEISYISTDPKVRSKQYKEFSDKGIKLPNYEDFTKRANQRLEDILVFEEEWWIIIEYKGVVRKITFLAGFCYDSASVPALLQMGNITKVNQAIIKCAAVHDVLFALQPSWSSFEDANNIFSGLLRWQDYDHIALVGYMFGVRSPVGAVLYHKASKTVKTHWFNGFVKFEDNFVFKGTPVYCCSDHKDSVIENHHLQA